MHGIVKGIRNALPIVDINSEKNKAPLFVKDDLLNLVAWFSHCDVEDLPSSLVNSALKPHQPCPMIRIIINEINLYHFPTEGIFTLCERDFWLYLDEEIVIPKNLILKDCSVARGSVTIYEGNLIAYGPNAIAHAVGPHATASAEAADSVAIAYHGATARAKEKGAYAIAKLEAIAFAEAPGSIAKAYGKNSFAIKTVEDAHVFDEDGATTLTAVSDTIGNTLKYRHFI